MSLTEDGGVLKLKYENEILVRMLVMAGFCCFKWVALLDVRHFDSGLVHAKKTLETSVLAICFVGEKGA